MFQQTEEKSNRETESKSERARRHACKEKRKKHKYRGFFGALHKISNQQKTEALQTDQT